MASLTYTKVYVLGASEYNCLNSDNFLSGFMLLLQSTINFLRCSYEVSEVSQPLQGTQGDVSHNRISEREVKEEFIRWPTLILLDSFLFSIRDIVWENVRGCAPFKRYNWIWGGGRGRLWRFWGVTFTLSSRTLETLLREAETFSKGDNHTIPSYDLALPDELIILYSIHLVTLNQILAAFVSFLPFFNLTALNSSS